MREETTSYLPVAAEWQVDGQAEQVVDEILKGREQVLHFLLRHPESQQHPDRHGERQPLALPEERHPDLQLQIITLWSRNLVPINPKHFSLCFNLQPIEFLRKSSPGTKMLNSALIILRKTLQFTDLNKTAPLNEPNTLLL